MSGGAVLEGEIAGWQEAFLAFHARFAPHFYRAAVRARSRAYRQARRDRIKRKNGWQLAEAMGEAEPDAPWAWAWRSLAGGVPAGWRTWLLVRRSSDDGELAGYRAFAPVGTVLGRSATPCIPTRRGYRAFAPEATALETLVRVAGTRWTIEQCLEEAKGEAGLDQYEVRPWHRWHRQITLSLVAHAFLAWLRQQAQRHDRSSSFGGGGKISASTPAQVAERATLVAVSVPEARRLPALALPWP